MNCGHFIFASVTNVENFQTHSDSEPLFDFVVQKQMQFVLVGKGELGGWVVRQPLDLDRGKELSSLLISLFPPL